MALTVVWDMGEVVNDLMCGQCGQALLIYDAARAAWPFSEPLVRPAGLVHTAALP